MKRALAIGAAAIAAAIVVGDQPVVQAELENQIFTAKSERLRLVVPRGWRATDQPSYPGLLLWMMRSEPEGKIVLTDEAFTRDVYCSWPVRCQMSHDALPAKVACALGAKLSAIGLHVGPVQAGPKENEEAGMPSVWFEYDDHGKVFIRQAVAIDEDHVVSLVLSAPTAEARNAHVRAFEQALRTLRPLNQEELGAIGSGSALPPAGSVVGSGATGSGASGAAGSGAGGSAASRSVGNGSAASGSSGNGSAASGSSGNGSAASGAAAAGSAATGSAAGSAGSAAPAIMARTMSFVSAPAPRMDPVGPCTKK